MEKEFEGLPDHLLPQDDWSVIKFEELSDYLINKSGQIWSKKHRRHLIQEVNPKGYMIVKLKPLGKPTKIFQTHRLLAEHFIPNPDNCYYVHHLNDNKLDNSLPNLAWSHQKERNPKKGEDHGRAKLNEEQVKEIRNIYGAGPTLEELAERFNVSYSTIRDIVTRAIWRHI